MKSSISIFAVAAGVLAVIAALLAATSNEGKLESDPMFTSDNWLDDLGI